MSANSPKAAAAQAPHEDLLGARSREAYENAFLNAFGTPQLCITSGEGVYVYDEQGRKYLDLLGGIAVNSLGYAHPALKAALTAQLERCTHVSNFFTTPAQLTLGERLQAIFEASGYTTPVKAFLANSGAEANEAALKLTRLHKPGGKVLALEHSFHGRTLGTLSITAKPAIRDPFEPLPSNVEFIDATPEALSAHEDENIAALFVEPIQGEAGVLPLSEGFLAAAREFCDRNNALLVVDEVQTGIGRTGRWLASEGLQADIVTLAKGLGGGVPIGAAVACSEAAQLFTPGAHGSTFGGNPLACAAACAVLGEVEKLLPQIRSTASFLHRALSEQGWNVRGEGLLIGIEVDDAPTLTHDLLTRGVIVNAANAHTVRLAPPLVITSAQLEPFLKLMAEYKGHEG